MNTDTKRAIFGKPFHCLFMSPRISSVNPKHALFLNRTDFFLYIFYLLAGSGRCPSLTVDVCSVSPHLMETEAVTSPLNALNQGLLS